MDSSGNCIISELDEQVLDDARVQEELLRLKPRIESRQRGFHIDYDITDFGSIKKHVRC